MRIGTAVPAFTPAPVRSSSALEELRRGAELLNGGQDHAALECFRSALARQPGLVPAHNNMGIALKNLRQFVPAEHAYRAAVAIEPDYAPAHHNLGELLCRLERFHEARICFERALAIDPGLHNARLNLGNLLTDMGELEAALRHYRVLVSIGWNLPGVYASLGFALSICGNAEEAHRCAAKAAELAPVSAQAHLNLARAALQLGDSTGAQRSAQRSLALNPALTGASLLIAAAFCQQRRWPEALAQQRAGAARPQSDAQIFFTLATQLLSWDVREAALECFDQVLQIEPNQATALHFSAALRGDNPDHCTPAYVEQLFDDAAEQFNALLVERLRYAAPAELARMTVESTVRDPPWDALDLGCGTGLFGKAISPHCRRLVGMDLSQNMLARARELKLYERLEQAEIIAASAREADDAYDLVGAVDVLIYIGKLDELVAEIRRILRPGGLFAFSIEVGRVRSKMGAAGFALTATGRYVHDPEYLQALARRCGFTIRHSRESTLRLENSRAVPGQLQVWAAEKAGADAR